MSEPKPQSPMDALIELIEACERMPTGNTIEILSRNARAELVALRMAQINANAALNTIVESGCECYPDMERSDPCNACIAKRVLRENRGDK